MKSQELNNAKDAIKIITNKKLNWIERCIIIRSRPYTEQILILVLLEEIKRYKALVSKYIDEKYIAKGFNDDGSIYHEYAENIEDKVGISLYSMSIVISYEQAFTSHLQEIGLTPNQHFAEDLANLIASEKLPATNKLEYFFKSTHLLLLGFYIRFKTFDSLNIDEEKTQFVKSIEYLSKYLNRYGDDNLVATLRGLKYQRVIAKDLYQELKIKTNELCQEIFPNSKNIQVRYFNLLKKTLKEKLSK